MCLHRDPLPSVRFIGHLESRLLSAGREAFFFSSVVELLFSYLTLNDLYD